LYSGVIVRCILAASTLEGGKTAAKSVMAAVAAHRNPLGVKGAGEGAIIPIGGLMVNAVANALTSFGAMPNQLPLSSARVWHMSLERK
jgi:hypothetical protein